MQQGKPTGIRDQDVRNLGWVDFEGKWGRIIRHETESRSSLELLVLGFGDSHLRLHGYFSGDEFMEVSRRLVG